jgi:hypothetical protein
MLSPIAIASITKETALHLATIRRHANVAAADRGERFFVSPKIISAREFITGLDAVHPPRSRLDVPTPVKLTAIVKKHIALSSTRPPSSLLQSTVL